MDSLKLFVAELALLGFINVVLILTYFIVRYIERSRRDYDPLRRTWQFELFSKQICWCLMTISSVEIVLLSICVALVDSRIKASCLQKQTYPGDCAGKFMWKTITFVFYGIPFLTVCLISTTLVSLRQTVEMRPRNFYFRPRSLIIAYALLQVSTVLLSIALSSDVLLKTLPEGKAADVTIIIAAVGIVMFQLGITFWINGVMIFYMELVVACNA